jgi:hypothetical protein
MIANKLQLLATEHHYSDFREITDSTLKNVAVCVVSYFLTGQIDSPYHHGLMEKMFSPIYNYESEWKWVLKNYKATEKVEVSIPDSPQGVFNIGYIDQNDRSGAHRSGWAHVFENIKQLNNSNAPILLDLYVDRTFHWKREIYKHIGVIPYRTPWIGFIHHTFDETFSEYNNKTLLDCPEFIESLPMCKGLIVLSNTLKYQFEHEFKERGIDQRPIYTMIHPTETNVPLFNMQSFLDNPDKKLIHIGGWLRNIFSFYQLVLNTSFHTSQYMSTNFDKTQGSVNGLSSHEVAYQILDYAEIPKGNHPRMKWCTQIRDFFKFSKKTANTLDELPPTIEYKIRKVALKGKYMDNYYPCDEFNKKLSNALTLMDGSTDQESKFCSQATIHNNWIKHMIEYLDKIHQKIEVLSAVDNKTYDDLLTNNLVFLNLVDGSAVNTLIECAVRNTPIFVNRHPAAIEILGEAYPLYYDEPNDINRLLNDPMALINANEYMKTLDKSPYNIDRFIKSLTNLLSII